MDYCMRRSSKLSHSTLIVWYNLGTRQSGGNLRRKRMAIVIKRSSITPTRAGVVSIHTTTTCVECGRVFDMFNEIDSEEWSFGHDCEA